jgi:hypothetical protein
MFSYSVKFVCGMQNLPTDKQNCSSVRPGSYATEINIHNFNPREEAKIEKRVLLLIRNDLPVGREPKFSRAEPFDTIGLPVESATMDDCCGIVQKLKLIPGHLNVGFLELLSSVELNVVAVYTATDLKAASIAIDVETITARKV